MSIKEQLFLFLSKNKSYGSKMDHSFFIFNSDIRNYSYFILGIKDKLIECTGSV